MPPNAPPPALTRARLLTWVLVASSVVTFSLVGLLGAGFFGPVVWAASLALIAMPVHRWLVRKTGDRPTLAASLSILFVALVVITPLAGVLLSATGQVAKVATAAQGQIKDNRWRETVARQPQLQKALEWVESQEGDISGQLQGVAGAVSKYAGAALASGAKTLTNVLLTLFFLFFFFRDHTDFLRYLRGLLPLTDRETDTLFERLHETVYATIYGTLVVRAIQGALGGLMFWFLGIPGAVLWGAVMAIVAIIPVAGAFVVWVPAAIYLAASGSMGKALILTVWGVGVIGTADNILYPTMVGDRLKMHTVPVFVATLGGLAVFGVTGLVVGPVILATADTLVRFWRQRTAAGRSADDALLP